jgi:hypothetical protein
MSGKGKTRVAPGGNLFAMAGGGSLTTFNDGGLLKNSLSQSTDQALIMANAMKNMPRPVVSVKDISKAQSRIEVREQTSTT